MTIHDMLAWRYATKQFDVTKPLSNDTLEYILAAGNLAATSYGLQPFKIVVVTDAEKKAALRAAAFNQPQVEQNSALLVLAARTDVDAAFIAEYARRIETTRSLEVGAVQSYQDMMTGHLTSLPESDRLVWAQKQAYIALGTMLVAAAEQSVDGCPMEGFDPAQFNNILGLTEHHLHATVLFAVGYRSADDATQHYKKVRRALPDTVVRM